MAHGVQIEAGPLNGVLLALPAILPLVVLIHALALPRLTALSPAIVRTIAELHADERPLAATGYTEDSLVFLTRGTITKLRRDDALAWLTEHPTGILVTKQGDLDPQANDLRVIDSITGFHFARGKPVTVELLERAP